jgi:hypothetical protein
MNRNKFFLIGTSVLAALGGSWYLARLGTAFEDDRTLIVNNAVGTPSATHVETSMTKKQAYLVLERESTERQAKIEFVKNNERPQRLAESVTRAIEAAQ